MNTIYSVNVNGYEYYFSTAEKAVEYVYKRHDIDNQSLKTAIVDRLEEQSYVFLYTYERYGIVIYKNSVDIEDI